MIKFCTVAILSIIWFFSQYDLLWLLNLSWRSKQTLLTGVLVLFTKIFNCYLTIKIQNQYLKLLLSNTLTLSCTFPFHQPFWSPSLLRTITWQPCLRGSWFDSTGLKSNSATATMRRNGHFNRTFNLKIEIICVLTNL